MLSAIFVYIHGLCSCHLWSWEFWFLESGVGFVDEWNRVVVCNVPFCPKLCKSLHSTHYRNTLVKMYHYHVSCVWCLMIFKVCPHHRPLGMLAYTCFCNTHTHTHRHDFYPQDCNKTAVCHTLALPRPTHIPTDGTQATLWEHSEKCVVFPEMLWTELCILSVCWHLTNSHYCHQHQD